MKAIVLTADRYAKITDHMLHTYRALWPSNPFRFRVAYQKYPLFLQEKYGDKIELVQTPSAIKATMKVLLEDVPDEEWIYYCMDDKYLISIDEQEVNKVYRWVRDIREPTIGGVAFCRARRLLEDAHLKVASRMVNPDGQVFIERKGYEQIGLHQFLRARVLKELFDGFPDRDFRSKEVDSFTTGKQTRPDMRLFVIEKNLVVFGESASRGRITPNCVESMKRFGLEVPQDFEVHRRSIVVGQLPRTFLGLPLPWRR